MSRRLKVLVTPKDPNPYQELLYSEVAAAGVDVIYEQGPTGSQTVNLLLAPLMLAWHRAHGVRFLHIHWVHMFVLPWAGGRNIARSAMQVWFALYLRVAVLLGYRVVWTAHDLLPHWPVFRDEARARSTLLKRSSLVFALSQTTADALAKLGVKDVRIIPHGSYISSYDSSIDRADARRVLGFTDDDLVILNIGRMQEYKGVDLLLEALKLVPKESPVKVLLAGECDDDDAKHKLEQVAVGLESRAVLHLHRIPDAEMSTYLRAADIGCFPFRAISNSGSILLAQSFALPLILPNLANLEGVPAASALRYEPGVENLRDALVAVADLSPDELQRMGAASLACAEALDWPSAARRTIEGYQAVLSYRDEIMPIDPTRG